MRARRGPPTVGLWIDAEYCQEPCCIWRRSQWHDSARGGWIKVSVHAAQVDMSAACLCDHFGPLAYPQVSRNSSRWKGDARRTGGVHAYCMLHAASRILHAASRILNAASRRPGCHGLLTVPTGTAGYIQLDIRHPTQRDPHPSVSQHLQPVPPAGPGGQVKGWRRRLGLGCRLW